MQYQDEDIRRMIIDTSSILYTNKVLLDNSEFVTHVIYITSNYRYYHIKNYMNYISDRLKDNKECAIKIMALDGMCLQYISDRLKSDNDIIKTALKKNAFALQYVPEKKRSIDIIKLAVSINGDTIKYAPQNIIDNLDIIMCGIINTPLTLKYVSSSIKKNKTNIMLFIQINHRTLQYIDDEYIDEEIFDIAFNKCSIDAIHHAPMRLKVNKNIALKVVKSNGMLIEFVAKSMRRDINVVFSAVRQNGIAFVLLQKNFKDNEELALIAFDKAELSSTTSGGYHFYISDIYRHLSDRLKKDKNIAIHAVSKSGLILAKMSKVFNDDYDIVLQAVTQNCNALNYVSDRLINDKEIVFRAITYGQQHNIYNPKFLSNITRCECINDPYIKHLVTLKGRGLNIAEKKLAWARGVSDNIIHDIMELVSNMVTRIIVDTK